MFCYSKEYELGIFEMNRDDVIEIDSLDELVLMDPSYQIYLPKGKEDKDELFRMSPFWVITKSKGA